MARYLSIPNSCIWFSCYICYSRGVLSDDWSVSVCVAFRCCVVVLLLYLMRFARFWFVTPILFFVHGFMSFEQRYTTVAFIYHHRTGISAGGQSVPEDSTSPVA